MMQTLTANAAEMEIEGS
ncbi:hypothetical protein R3I94_017876 [Phoxinus phoxinus]